MTLIDIPTTATENGDEDVTVADTAIDEHVVEHDEPLLGRASWRGRNRPGGGWSAVVEPPQEYRGSSYQVCGVWPWSWAGSTITAGVPLGRHLTTQATVCCDPIHWFAAKIITNPSVFIIANTGLGKSTMVRHMITGMAGCGIVPVILGDIRPDYRTTVQSLEGGQVVEIGRGRGAINPLDLGELGRYADDMDAHAATETDPARIEELSTAAHRLRMEAHARSKNLTRALVELKRKGVMNDAEDEVLSRAIEELAAEFNGQDRAPQLSDLDRKLDSPSDYLMEAVLARGDRKKYHERVDGLQTTVRALCGSDWGPVFNAQTTERLRMDATAIDVDISSLKSLDVELEAAVLLATWAEGYGAIEAANTIADLGLGPQRRFFIVLDELWKIVRTSMVDKIDQLTRLNRAEAAGQAMITHSLDDLESPAQESDRAKARGFITRAGMVIMGGLPLSELRGGDGKDGLQKVVYLSQKEIDLVASWEDGGSLSGRRRNRRGDKPPGAGKFLIKVGTKPGLPVEVITTPAENELLIHDTNNRWNDTATIDLTDDTHPPATVDVSEPPAPQLADPEPEPVEPEPVEPELVEAQPAPEPEPIVPAAATTMGEALASVPSQPASTPARARAAAALPFTSPIVGAASTSTTRSVVLEVAMPPAPITTEPAPLSDADAGLQILSTDSDADPFSAYSYTEGEDDMASYTRYAAGGRPTVTTPPPAEPRRPRRPAAKPAKTRNGASWLSQGNRWMLIPASAFAVLVLFVIVAANQLGGGDAPVATQQQVANSSTVNVMSAHAFQGAAVPVSSSAGPANIDEVRASGFAHSELGAAMAALHLSVRTDPYTGPSVFTPAIQEQATGDTAAYLATRQKQYEALAKAAKVPAGQPVIAPTGEMVGWKIPTGWKTDGPVTVHLLLKLPNSGKYVDIAPTVVWDATANDYKLAVTADGTWPSTTTTPEAGYTKFIS